MLGELLILFNHLKLGVFWKLGHGYSSSTRTEPTNQGSLHPFQTNGLESLDFNEGGALWLSR